MQSKAQTVCAGWAQSVKNAVNRQNRVLMIDGLLQFR